MSQECTIKLDPTTGLYDYKIGNKIVAKNITMDEVLELLSKKDEDNESE